MIHFRLIIMRMYAIFKFKNFRVLFKLRFSIFKNEFN